MLLSVVICTYNPKPEILQKVLGALQEQSLEKGEWELIIIDNCSKDPVAAVADLSWHPQAKLILESKPGLFHARVAGAKSAQTDLIVFVDDDNVLDTDYLKTSFNFHRSHPEVGCFGGKSLPVFEKEPPAWFSNADINLGCQNYGDELYVSDLAATNFTVAAYPEKAPIGTGMVIQKRAFLAYLQEAVDSPERTRLGRRGASLSSGEDNDIILSIIKKRFEIAYVPDLVVHHLIPPGRCTPGYLQKMAFESNRTWIKVLQIHGINPRKKIGKWTLVPRKVRSYWMHRAWRSPLAAIRWKSSCGTFKGLAEI